MRHFAAMALAILFGLITSGCPYIRYSEKSGFGMGIEAPAQPGTHVVNEARAKATEAAACIDSNTDEQIPNCTRDGDFAESVLRGSMTTDTRHERTYKTEGVAAGGGYEGGRSRRNSPYGWSGALNCTRDQIDAGACR